MISVMGGSKIQSYEILVLEVKQTGDVVCSVKDLQISETRILYFPRKLKLSYDKTD